eukprot:4570405-Amphidinium_carterae.2
MLSQEAPVVDNTAAPAEAAVAEVPPAAGASDAEAQGTCSACATSRSLTKPFDSAMAQSYGMCLLQLSSCNHPCAVA